jgi:hypothetical protein
MLDQILAGVICGLFALIVAFGWLMGGDNPHTAGAVVFFRPKTFLSPSGSELHGTG